MAVYGDAFSQADLNQDGVVDRGEFQNFVGGNTYGFGGAYGAGLAGGVYGAGLAGGVYGAGLAGGVSSYESSSYVDGGVADAGVVGVGYGGVGLAGASYVSGGADVVSGGAAYDASYSSAAYGASDAVAVGATNVATVNTQIYQDPNPQIIRRPAPGGAATYTQNIRVRFLQPPPVPPPGPIIIKEVRPPQPPVLPPLRVTQRAPPLPNPPPLILRERPPVPPPVVPGRTVIRPLPAIPVPPRSLIIERLPAPPRRPRDIFIERWLQYGPQAKQQTLVQRAGPAVRYQAPRNTIIQYDQAQARIVRNFQRLGVQAFSPAAYVQQYGATLLDAGTLVSQARAAGVVEDLTPPGLVTSAAASSVNVGLGGAVGVGGAVVDAGVVGVGGAWGGSSLVGGSVVDAGVVGVGGGWGSGVSGAWGTGLVGGAGTLLGNVADAAFTAGDLDASGGLDRAEFNNLLTGGGADAYLPTPW